VVAPVEVGIHDWNLVSPLCLAPKTPPKQGPNSNQNKAHLGFRGL